MTAKKTASKRPAAKSAVGKVKKVVKPAPRKPVPRSASPAAARATGQSAASHRSAAMASELLRAGINALSIPRAESAVADGLSKIADSFGLKKLEDVFDHRVAAALERLGYPSAAELRRQQEKIDEILQLLKKKRRG